MKILITGGCGYIGSLLYTHLSPAHEVESIDAELYGNPGIKNDAIALHSYLEKVTDSDLASFDAVINLASVSSVSLCKKFRYEAIDTNVTQFLKLADRLPNSTKIIYASSSCVYGHGLDCTEVTKLDLTDDLSITKGMLDSYMQVSNKTYFGLRLGSVNGWSPNRRTDLMINAMDLSAKDSGKVSVFNGRASRPILGTADLKSAIDCILAAKKPKSGVYNLHSFNAKICNIAKAVADYHKVDIEVLADQPSFNFEINSSKFKRSFKWQSEETIESIIGSLQVSSSIQSSRIV